MKKNYQDLIEKGLLKEEQIGFTEIGMVLTKAKKSLESAEVLRQKKFFEGAYEMAYEAMLRAGRALIFSFCLRPRVAGSHKTTVEFCARIFGDATGILITMFDTMRKKRHYLVYGAGLDISEFEAEHAIISARDFIYKIEKIISDKNPQQKLI
jgi:uncharacterized protein (UPF0332 family)